MRYSRRCCGGSMDRKSRTPSPQRRNKWNETDTDGHGTGVGHVGQAWPRPAWLRTRQTTFSVMLSPLLDLEPIGTGFHFRPQPPDPFIGDLLGPFWTRDSSYAHPGGCLARAASMSA